MGKANLGDHRGFPETFQFDVAQILSDFADAAWQAAFDPTEAVSQKHLRSGLQNGGLV